MADSLIYETSHLITEDYPPGNEQDVLLRYGDRIVEVRRHWGWGTLAWSVTLYHKCHSCHLLHRSMDSVCMV